MWVETGVVERVILEVPEGLVELPTTGEQQRRVRVGVEGKTLEQASLVVGDEVKDAVPGDQAVEGPTQCEMAHVADLPGRVRKPRFRQVDQRWRAVDPGHVESKGKQVAADWVTGAASDIEDGCSFGEKVGEAIEPFPFNLDLWTTGFVPCPGVALIDLDYYPRSDVRPETCDVRRPQPVAESGSRLLIRCP